MCPRPRFSIAAGIMPSLISRLIAWLHRLAWTVLNEIGHETENEVGTCVDPVSLLMG